MEKFDYLITGSNVQTLAFAQSLLRDPDQTIALVDCHARPGAARLDLSHAAVPAAFGLPNQTFGKWDAAHPKPGTRSASAYLDWVLQDRLLPTGRVRYFPRSVHWGSGRIETLDTGHLTHVTIAKKTVRTLAPNHPPWHAHIPCFRVEPGVNIMTARAAAALPSEDWDNAPQIAVLGAGRVAMNIALDLLGQGVPGERIVWVRNRDPWLLNADGLYHTATDHAGRLVHAATILRNIARAVSTDEVCARLERLGLLLRLSPDIRPSVFRGVASTHDEVKRLQAITHIVRKGHVHGISPIGMLFDHGAEPMHVDSIYIDCTSSPPPQRARPPVFQDDLIHLQSMTLCPPGFDAALIGEIETLALTDQEKNDLCAPLPVARDAKDIIPALLGHLINQRIWMLDAAMGPWLQRHPVPGLSPPPKPSRLQGPSSDWKQYRAAMVPAIATLQMLADEAA
ncbi:MAG: hypothetical protein AAGH49_04590 [Pseudomonadota bacterium]